MKRLAGWAAALLLWTALTSGAAAESKRYETSFLDVFDTFSQVVVYADTQEAAQEILQSVHDELKNYHQLFDIYHAYEGVNNLYTVNQNAGIAPVAVDEAVYELVAFGKEMFVQTGGKTNMALGSVLSIWHEYRELGLEQPEYAAIPTVEELLAAAKHADIEQVVLNPEERTVYLADPQMSLDVGAIAKGYAVERTARKLEAQGVQSLLMSIGGNLRSIGKKGDGTPWRAGVQNPDLTAAEQNLTVIDLTDASLVTSGSYQRYYTVDGKQYHHIIDPDTLYPAEYSWAVSVLAEDSGLADALSTALFAMPVEDGKALVNGWEGVEALWVWEDGTLEYSDGWPK